jgi:branched-chain amino acid transport system permease protein
MRPSGIYDVNYQQDQSILRTRVDWFWTAVIGAVLLGLPLLSSQGPFGASLISLRMLTIFTTGGIYLIAATGLNILLGYNGQISLGQAAFMMVGAYTSALLVRDAGFPFLFGLPVAAIVSGVVGLLFGLASLRVKGFYLAMATLAAQFVIPWAITSYDGEVVSRPFRWLDPLGDALRDLDFGGTETLAPSIRLFGQTLDNQLGEYYVVITGILARNLIRSRVGRAWISIRDNDLAAEQLGINVFRYKVLAFFVCAVYAGIAGSLKAHVDGSITKDAYTLEFSIELLAMLVIGGAGFPLGPTFGVAFFLFMDRYLVKWIQDLFEDQIVKALTFVDPANVPGAMPPLLLGLLLALFLIFQPRGLAYRWLIIQSAWRLRPFSKI